MSIRKAFENIGKLEPDDLRLREADGEVNERYATVILTKIGKPFSNRHRRLIAFQITVVLRDCKDSEVIASDGKFFESEGEADDRFNLLVKEYNL